MPLNTPAESAATSTLTFSVSSCTSVSPASTASPSCLSHAPTVASTTDSPSVGTRTSVGMARDSLQGFGNDAVLFCTVNLAPALGRARAFGSTHVAGLSLAQQRRQPRGHEGPCAHVA